jgi:glutamate/tyrosine decarboxylase-like PLP-dependent enzyme
VQPYDCGIFLSKHLDLGVEVFENPNAAYLNTASTESTVSRDRTIPSPLNIGIENSRRFRALPVYATLAAYGRVGYCEMLQRQIALARGIAQHILRSDEYELLPQLREGDSSETERLQDIYIIVLFRARDEQLNSTLVQRINAGRKVYVSGTSWDGQPAVRFAIANWQVDVEGDLRVVVDVLGEVVA